MASRALLRRRKYLLSSLNQPSWSIRGFPNFEHDNASKADNPHILRRFAWHSSSDDTEPTNEAVLHSTARHEVSFLTGMGLLRHNTFQVPHSLLSTARGNYSSISRFSQLSQSRHLSSLATASQSVPSSGNDKNEENRKVKETSPEECDQAVEGLSSVKAKAKAKKLQESQKSEISVIKRFWSVVLGIGPALKAVASMSREDWANKLLHWKDEFKSTMQHYWLGTKLLWADVRISVRLLLKVARGKGLSRRERQQLTRTTVDIFRLVPFAVFIIVPFMEFLLPVFLKLFPNMLPSTFQDKMKEQTITERPRTQVG